ncbi:MAG: hypothetical protein KatS3mg107_0835 [Gemmataceae bacterium]|nr:MAG: hypothetical protein KatS3mg107_0835 [Gemmataceae bacterium]
MWHPSKTLLQAAILLLTLASPAYANAIAPTAYFWPGVLPLMGGMALPASVLAAVLERPFVSHAGVREYAFWYSLQANLISLAIGYATLPVGVDAIFSIGPLWSLIAVAMSIGSEGWYYQWRAVQAPERLRWRWIVAGNVLQQYRAVAPASYDLGDQGGAARSGMDIGPVSECLVLGKRDSKCHAISRKFRGTRLAAAHEDHAEPSFAPKRDRDPTF